MGFKKPDLLSGSSYVRSLPFQHPLRIAIVGGGSCVLKNGDWCMKRKCISASGASHYCVIDLIGLITGHNGPGGSGQLYGQRSRNDVVGFARA